MDTAYYEEIQGRLHGLLIRLGDRLPKDDQHQVNEFIDHNELGLALELMADILGEECLPVSTDEHKDMLALAEHMQMDDRVPRPLDACPTRA